MRSIIGYHVKHHVSLMQGLSFCHPYCKRNWLCAWMNMLNCEIPINVHDSMKRTNLWFPKKLQYFSLIIKYYYYYYFKQLEKSIIWHDIRAGGRGYKLNPCPPFKIPRAGPGMFDTLIYLSKCSSSFLNVQNYNH